MSKKQTAVDQLSELFYFKAKLVEDNKWVISEEDMDKIIEQSKELEKQNLIDAVDEGINICGMSHIFVEKAEQYYNNTFNQ